MSEIEVPDGWKLKKLFDICDVDSGFAFKSNSFQTNGIPLIRIGNIQNDQIVFENNTVFLDKKLIETHKKFLVEKNQILIALSGATTGKSAINRTDKTAFLNQRVGRILFHTDEPNLQKYVYYFIKKIGFEIFKKSYGGAQPNVSPTSIGNFEIMIPDDDKKLSIAVTKLDHILGESEEKKKQIISLIEQNKERINFFENNWLSYIINKEIEHHPQRKEWELTTIGNEVEFAYGKNLPKPERIDGDYPVYGSNGIVGTHNEFLIDFPSIVIGRKGTVGALHKTNKKFWPTDVSFYTKIINPKKLDLDFLYYLLSHLKLEKIKQSGPKSGLNRNDAYKIPISLPGPQTQKQIIKNIKLAETKFQSQKQQFEKIKESYDSRLKYINHIQFSILDVAFSGKLVN